jgi:hypothetical protein
MLVDVGKWPASFMVMEPIWGKEPEMDHRIHVYLAWFMNSIKMQEISFIGSDWQCNHGRSAFLTPPKYDYHVPQLQDYRPFSRRHPKGRTTIREAEAKSKPRVTGG